MKLGRALNPRATHENTLTMRSSWGIPTGHICTGRGIFAG